MPAITVELPSLLRPLAANQRSLALEARSLRQAIRELAVHHPALFGAVCDESGRFRPHVLCLLNEANTRWLEQDDVPLQDGDVIRFLQAVSGG
ncbi:MAG: MoaD/ThiS family protein [Planctomycetota bacterium]